MEELHTYPIINTDKLNFKLKISIVLNLILTVVEIIAGFYGGSVSLIADGIHNLTDTGSLIITLFARKIGLKPADHLNTFGYRRAEIIGALTNIITLVISGLFLMYKSIEKVFNPETIDGGFVIMVASLALIVDVFSALLIYKESKDDLNIKSAFLHSVSDSLASLSVIIVGVLVMYYEWYIADVIATFLISGYMLVHGAMTAPRIIRILMGSVPDNISVDEIIAEIEKSENVVKVRNIFVWEVYQGFISLEAIIKIQNQDQYLDSLQHIKKMLKEKFGVNKAIIELTP